MSDKKFLQSWFAPSPTKPLSCQRGIQQWYLSTAGQQAADAVRSLTQVMISDVFGYYALQIGELAGSFDLLDNCRVGRHFAIGSADSAARENLDLIADADALPIDFDNIDLVVASHVLDCARSPHQVLREIERVLVPEGHCVLIGFNPLSWKGITLFWWRLLRRQSVPAAYTKFRIHDWFTVLGFEVLESRSVGCRGGLVKSAVVSRIGVLNWLAGQYCQWFGSVQVIHVRKKVSRQIPLKPRLRSKSILKPGIAVNGSSVGKSMKQTHEQETKQL